MKKNAIIAIVALITLGACKQTPKNKNLGIEKNNTTMEVTEQWDKVFPKSDKVEHRKVTFHNRYGILLVGDLYSPKEAKSKLPAIAVSGPFGAVKEQSSGLYAQQMAERGFVTLAFDPSFTGESGGNAYRIASPDINTEDFCAAVDFLSNLEEIDPEKIGIIGICGWGGMALNAAVIDTRIKATVAATMYDMTRVISKGYNDTDDNEEARHNLRQRVSEQRTENYRNKIHPKAGGVIDPLPENVPQFIKDYHAYYKTPRGYHERSGNSTDGWEVTGVISFANQPILAYSNEIRSSVLIIHGEKAHSLYFAKDAYKNMIENSKYANNKELFIIPNASHVDLYDNQAGVIPFDKMADFFKKMK